MRRARERAHPLCRQQVRLDRRRDAAGDLVLQGENVAEFAIVALRPMVPAGVASISCALMRKRLPARRTLPSST